MADRILGGRYTVQDKVGIGGMATVYRGLDNVLGRTVAIKTMLPQYAADPSFAARFKQEAQAAAALQSPYIVGVYDWGRDQDTYYIVMEYLRGTDLKSGIRKHGALDCRKVAQIGSQICQALSVAHKHDIIHRDIKPQNIMVQPDGNIKVMDFGIARAKNSHLTADNSVLGTAHYVSPEQTQGKELGPTSDLYSLGVVMYEAACGKVPFDGDDAISVALKQVNEQPVPPSQVNPNIDATLEGIILKCMQKNPADRFQTADELRRVLNDYLAGRIVNLGEATSLINANTTAQMKRGQGGQTQAMARTAAAKPIAATGRISTSNAAGANRKNIHVPEEKHTSKGKIAGIIIAVIAVIAAAAIAFSTLTGGSTQAVPSLTNITEDQAISAIQATNGFFVYDQAGSTEEYSDTVAEGTVISQDPAYDISGLKKYEKGTKIKLVVSKGKQPAAKVKVPDLTGKTAEEATQLLESMGLKATPGDGVESSDIEVNRIVSQEPVGGTEVDEGSSVTYHQSTGTGSADAGDHTGAYYEDAINDLSSNGLTNVNVNYVYSSTVSKGYVVSQSPTGKQSKDTSITLNVSKGKDPASVSPTSPTTPSTNTGTNTGGGGSSTGGNTGGGSNTGDNGSGDTSGDEDPDTGTN